VSSRRDAPPHGVCLPPRLSGTHGEVQCPLLSGFRELELQVAGVAEAECPLGTRAMLGLAQGSLRACSGTIQIGVAAAVTAIETSWLLATET
jgi:hypothetical protein